MASNEIPDIVIGRLPIYLRALNFLLADGREITSSQELGDRLGISSAQIRKDLSHFGEFGKQGTGYDIDFLREKLRGILNVDRMWGVVVVGAGGLGQAIARYGGFAGRGLNMVAIFDNHPDKIGLKSGALEVQDITTLPDVVQQQQIRVGIIAVPAASAQEVARLMVDCGIKSILNYAPITLIVPSSIKVQHIDPVVHLQRMIYYLG